MANWWDSMSLFSQVLCCIAVPATIILLIQTILSFIGMGDHGGDSDVGGDHDIGDHDCGFDHDIGGHDVGFDHDIGGHDVGFDHDIGGHDVGFDHDIGGHDCGFDHDVGDVHGEGIYGENEAVGDHDPTGSYGLRIFTFRTVISFFAVFGWVGVVLDAAGLDHIISLSVAFVAGFAVMLLIAFLIRAAMRLQSDGTIDIRNALGQSGTVYLTVPANRSGRGKVNVTVQGTYSEFDAVTDSDTPLSTGCEVIVIGISSKDTLIIKKK